MNANSFILRKAIFVSYFARTMFLVIFLGGQYVVFAEAGIIDESLIVYIECRATDGKVISKGSGVVVSDDGRVLTAKHVIPDGSNCFGVQGTAATIPMRKLILGKLSAQYDARIVRFVPNQNEKFLSTNLIRISSEMKGKSVSAYGYPNTGTGEPSIRKGNIATTTPDEQGMVQTVALTAIGMSGGPVFLEDGRLIGIVSGAEFDGSGTPTHYAILAIQTIIQELELQSEEITAFQDQKPPILPEINPEVKRMVSDYGDFVFFDSNKKNIFDDIGENVSNYFYASFDNVRSLDLEIFSFVAIDINTCRKIALRNKEGIVTHIAPFDIIVLQEMDLPPQHKRKRVFFEGNEYFSYYVSWKDAFRGIVGATKVAIQNSHNYDQASFHFRVLFKAKYYNKNGAQIEEWYLISYRYFIDKDDPEGQIYSIDFKQISESDAVEQQRQFSSIPTRFQDYDLIQQVPYLRDGGAVWAPYWDDSLLARIEEIDNTLDWGEYVKLGHTIKLRGTSYEVIKPFIVNKGCQKY